jgi:hypothetical protein
MVSASQKLRIRTKSDDKYMQVKTVNLRTPVTEKLHYFTSDLEKALKH